MDGSVNVIMSMECFHIHNYTDVDILVVMCINVPSDNMLL